MGKKDTSPVVFVVFASIAIGVVAGFIGWSMNDEPTDVEKSSQQLDATIAALAKGTTAPTLTWPQPWPAEHPVLFGGIIGIAALVIGLIIIIAINTSRRPNT